MAQKSTDNTVIISADKSTFKLTTSVIYTIPKEWYTEFGEYVWVQDFHGNIFTNIETRMDGLKFKEIIENTEMKASWLLNVKSINKLCLNQITENDAKQIVVLWRSWIQDKIKTFCQHQINN